LLDKTRPFSTGLNSWEASSLREYLNTEFLNGFSSAEKNRIVEVTIETRINTTEKAKDTIDKVFLLSAEEAVKYFSKGKTLNLSNGYPQSYGDDFNGYRMAGKPFQDNDGTNFVFSESWFLRTPDRRNGYVAYVTSSGSIEISGRGTGCHYAGHVRPAMWIML
jgi:hypothetical protein